MFDTQRKWRLFREHEHWVLEFPHGRFQSKKSKDVIEWGFKLHKYVYAPRGM